MGEQKVPGIDEQLKSGSGINERYQSHANTSLDLAEAQLKGKRSKDSQ